MSIIFSSLAVGNPASFFQKSKGFSFQSFHVLRRPNRAKRGDFLLDFWNVVSKIADKDSEEIQGFGVSPTRNLRSKFAKLHAVCIAC